MAIREHRSLCLLLLLAGCPGRSGPEAGGPSAVQPTPAETAATGCTGQPAPPVGKPSDASAYCVGFSPDGSVGYVVLRPDQGNNLGIHRAYALYRVDLTAGAAALKEVLADHSDSYAVDDAAEQGNGDGGTYEGDARDRSDQEMIDHLPRLDALIKKEGLQACGAAVSRPGGWQAEIAGQTLTLDTPDPDEVEPDRPPAPVVAHWADRPERTLFELAQGDPEQSESVYGVFFHPCFPRLVVVIGVENDVLRLEPVALEP